MNKFDKIYKLVMESVGETTDDMFKENDNLDLEAFDGADEDDVIKYFKNGKTFSSYCRFRYGSSKKIWDDNSLWQNAGRYAIAFNQTRADEKFGVKNDGSSYNPLKPAHREAAWDEENYAERRMEDMMDYIHSGAGLDAYYRDQEDGYAY